MPSDSKLTRIGVFYDGNFFFHVSNYYLTRHFHCGGWSSNLASHGPHSITASTQLEKRTLVCRIVRL